MSTDSPVIYYDRTEPGPQKNGYQPQRHERVQIRLTPDEVRVLKECNRESFYYRSMPFALVAMTATHLAVRKGFLKPNPKWGSTLKQIGAGFFGWFLGKLSYRSICEEKFLNMTNSSIAEAIRKKRGYSLQVFPDPSLKEDESLGFGDEGHTSLLSDSDYHSSFGSLNLDTDKNVQYSDLDDRDRSSYDNVLTEQKPAKSGVTYEELRRKNRERAGQPQSSQYSQSSPSSSSSKPWESYSSSDRSGGAPPPKNIYGDTWER